ncbi:RHS repeat-associated core domain-containing protein [Nonomuraea endophytica]|uniref:RHS repeat-associated core domain-containing protein n=1 Tax=Nonomuraea endophytica TaxID=714136 RepID=UPI0037C6F3C1
MTVPGPASTTRRGNPTASLLPGGVRVDRTFDHLNRLTAETGAGGGAASAERTFSYDLAGRATAIGDLKVEYNDRGLPLSVKKGTVQQTGYAYNELGAPSQRVDAAGTATFTWDNVGRLATAVDPVTGRTLTYGYDKSSRLKTLTGKTSTGAASDSQTFTYDAVNRLETQMLKNGTGTQLAKITYGWDKDDNLTTKTTAGTAGAGTNTYTYDHAGRLTSWTAPGGTKTDYGWDASGNRTKAGTKTFTYDERNRLTTGDGTDHTYTPRGTLATETKAGATTQLTFDAFDRLIADGDSLYSYDALNRVTSRIRGTTKQTFAYSGLGNDLAAIADTSGAIQAKYGRNPFGDLLGLQEGTSPATGAFTDLHRDLVATFTTTALATSTAYDPFGTVTAQTGTKANLGYQSEYTDPDTGKTNMHARWYQPGTGTFPSRDTATLNPNPSVQANRYTYANASPLTGIDPTGHATASTGLEYGGSGSMGDPCGIQSPIQRCGGTGTGGIMLGSSLGGGGGSIACSGPDLGICGAADFSIVAEMDPEWYYENFIKPTIPSFDEEEAKRIGAMEDGRPAPKGYWNESQEVRDAYRAAYALGLSDKALASLWTTLRSKGLKQSWASAGGQKGGSTAKGGGCYKWQGMDGCITKGHYDVLKESLKYGKVRLDWTDAHAGTYANLVLTDPKKAKKYLDNFKQSFIKAHKAGIMAAAKMYGIPPYLLAAILYAEAGGDPPVADKVKNAVLETFSFGGADWDTTFGVASINLFNAARALGYDPKSMTEEQYNFLKATIKDPVVSIFTAAAYMAYIKKGYPAPWTAPNVQHTVAAQYNGTGPDAQSYADRYMNYLPIVKELLK